MQKNSTAGQQPDNAATKSKDFLDDYVGLAVKRLQEERDPSSFQQVANGAGSQTLTANKDYYI